MRTTAATDISHHIVTGGMAQNQPYHVLSLLHQRGVMKYLLGFQCKNDPTLFLMYTE